MPKPSSILLRQSFPAILFIALNFFWYLMLRIILPYTSGETDIDFLQTKQHIIHLSHYRWAFYLHIFSSLWLLGSGLTQFSSFLLKRYPSVHRWIGKVYIGIILFVSGPAALIMAYYANGDLIGQISFMTLSILWWWVTFRGYQAIRNEQIKAHGEWMIRSYALTFSAITLRIMQFYFATFTTIDSELAYQIIAFPSWILNILIAEWIIRKASWMKWVYI
jgi:Predicted membrane protein (DUF2306)